MADDFYIAMGRRIRERRKALGLTQGQLAEKAGTIGESYVARIEAGRGKPTLDVLRAIADALSVDVAALVSEAGGETWRSEDRRLVAALRKLDARDMTLVTTLVERWVTIGKPPNRRRRK